MSEELGVLLELSCHCHCRELTLSRATCCARRSWARAAEGGALDSDGRRPPRTSSDALAFVRASGSAADEWYARPTPETFALQRTSSAFGVESWRSDAHVDGAHETVEMAHEALGQAHWTAPRLVTLLSGAWHWAPNQPSEHMHADSTHTP